MKKSTYIYILSLLLLVACQKDEDVFVVNDSKISSLSIGVVGGLITDVNGTALSNVSVDLHTSTSTYSTQTDDNGVFYFRDLDLAETRTHLSVRSAGYFAGSRAFVPKKGNTEFMRISLLPIEEVGTFNAEEGATIDLPEGAQIIFEANAIQDANGDLHTGTVYVANNFIAANHSKINLLMPGDLSALDANGQWQSLATYGMMAVRLYDDAGALLEIAPGDLATLRTPIIETQISAAPSSIGLWIFDSANGYWVSGGQAQRAGNFYESVLSDVTFLNWAIPYPLVDLTINLQLTANEAAYANALVEVVVVGSGVCAYGRTDDAGVLESGVAANQVLALRVIGDCGELLYEGEIGPYGIDTKLGAIHIESNNTTLISCEGKLVDCNGGAVAQGYARIDIGTQQHILFTGLDGSFSAYIDACDADILTIKGVDINKEGQSNVQDFQVTSVLDLGEISTCE